MRFHPDLHWRQLAERLHRGRPSHPAPHLMHSLDDDAEAAKATLYVATIALLVLLFVFAGIAFGQEAMHWLGVG
ncbi:hypothetical protein BKK79_11875 [Cupriavidus sp. USMAA2-4]|uniref:Uncharacterized protein n=1 Tax=Cupriavidus malaysiensis TaxID=367825 RepID=A0ABN4TCJ8_9BURK|nr:MULTISPECIES: hypothetical protein [Cupriavidus]AOY92402.1 hypothetical protein BKK79_11875 [Cupriavidus sp. USMAA2-4]AOY98015.1 hypothetical protein BKK81_00945 [Cupriavidus sp. USMAHM13]AOZ04443.1 hypothetical protein BKK80_00275 [Cupriavidus malaysiensis]